MFVGALACAAIFFGARYITATVFETPLSLYALRVLAPTLFITAFLGVLRGFFQGMENMYPSAVSQVLEQLVNAFVSVLAAYFFASKGGQIGRVLANEEGYHAAYGAAGASLGTTVGAAFSLLFLYILYKGFVRIWRKKMRKEHAKRVPYEVLFRKMFFTVLPFLAASALFNLNIVIEQGIFKHMMKGAAQAEQVALWWAQIFPVIYSAPHPQYQLLYLFLLNQFQFDTYSPLSQLIFVLYPIVPQFDDFI